MDSTIHADNDKAEEMIQEITLFVGRIAAGIFGAVAGAILTALLVWTLCRFTVRRQPPRPTISSRGSSKWQSAAKSISCFCSRANLRDIR